MQRCTTSGSLAVIMLLSFSPTNSCFNTKDGKKNSLCIKDRNLIIQTVMSGADNASINCLGLEVNMEKAHVTLHKETELYFSDFQKTQITNISKEKQRFSVHVKNDTIYYVIDMPQVNDTGLYNCTVAHGNSVKTTLTFLHVKDPGLQVPVREGQSLAWLMLASGCGVLALYNFITTIVSCSFAWKLRHRDTYQNNYVNTRPGDFSRVK